jgi:uncharacterized cysteine cluster protein YcgN (CxxCxxCC family)
MNTSSMHENPDFNTQAATANLCDTCGMCCDGTLFDSTALGPSDSERKLSSLGLRIKRKKNLLFFLQPCAAHCGSRCSIYENRPTRCRDFSCRQLRGVTLGEITETSARKKVSEARERVEAIRLMIDRIVETNPKRSLARRVANALTPKSPDERTLLHDSLESAMNDLESFLDQEFRVGG